MTALYVMLLRKQVLATDATDDLLYPLHPFIIRCQLPLATDEVLLHLSNFINSRDAINHVY
ncbi:hypothetical protein [Dulcicalothrix desertica]|uniref:hypothetical protein n=1 Tax=Dulcicalothrix desertica TaxID=32056 RepID=UPI000F8ECF8F|nr:hypothetical protein [Dulcicalothrix desertica]